jgi:hypothetical protein
MHASKGSSRSAWTGSNGGWRLLSTRFSEEASRTTAKALSELEHDNIARMQVLWKYTHDQLGSVDNQASGDLGMPWCAWPCAYMQGFGWQLQGNVDVICMVALHSAVTQSFPKWCLIKSKELQLAWKERHRSDIMLICTKDAHPHAIMLTYTKDAHPHAVMLTYTKDRAFNWHVGCGVSHLNWNVDTVPWRVVLPVNMHKRACKHAQAHLPVDMHKYVRGAYPYLTWGKH